MKYEEKYAEEMNLNHNFNLFVKNIQSAYGGYNTAQSQIGAKYTKKERELDGFTEHVFSDIHSPLL